MKCLESSMEEKHDLDTKSNEHTPLLQDISFMHRHGHHPHYWVRRCYTALSMTASLVLITLIFLGSSIGGGGRFFSERGIKPASHQTTIDHENEIPHSSWPESEGIKYEALKQILLSTPDGEKAKEWSKYHTAGPHLAGKNLSQAEWTRDKWVEFGIHHAEIVTYDVYINYPLDAGLSMLKAGKTAFRATLKEEPLSEDPTTGLPDGIPAFHGYSADGNVTGQFVYANYGTFKDYQDLLDAGIEFKDKIVLTRYGAIFRGLKVKRASELGAIGVVMFSDPGDDGEITEANGYLTYPNGPARNPSSLQRGSCEYLSVSPGDPTTVGYPSKPGVHRQSVDGKIPDIPSIPISYRDALPLLKALNGHGPNASNFPRSWQTGGLRYKGVEYNIGPSPDSIVLNLFNEQEYVTTPIWNTIGIINGTIANEVIIIGNHRDAWIAGGAGDPNSGSAALNEVIRSFGKALKAGWEPHRTIVFASWDGEEYGMIGSTEWVEEYLPWLSDSAIAYINVDTAARGPIFASSAAPVLNSAIYEATSQVLSPNQTIEGQTVRDLWDGQISTIGSGSDFTAFQDFAGVSSVELGFKAGPKDPVHHYHSNYDSSHWMDTYGDPDYQYHITISKIILLLAAKLVEEPVIQFNATDYAFSLEKYTRSAKTVSETSNISADVVVNSFAKIDKAISAFREAAIAFDTEAVELEQQLRDNISTETKRSLYKMVRDTNTRYKFLERSFLHGAGLDNRSWFKHVVFAPGRWTGYAGATLPGLIEALEDDDGTALEKWASIISDKIDGAHELLLNSSDRCERSKRT